MDFKILFDQAPFGKVVIANGGHIVLVNKSFCTMLGYSNEELLQMQYKDLLHPNYRKKYEQELELVLKGNVDTLRMVQECLSKKGEIVKVIYQLRLIKDEINYPTGCMAEIVEINELVSESANQENDIIYLKALMESSPDLIYFKNRESQLIKFSDSFKDRLPFLEGQILGKTDFDFFTDEHAQQAFDDEQNIIRTGVPIIDLEEKETFFDGHVNWMSATKLPLRNLAGEIIGTFGISRDITKRKLQEGEIREKNNILNAITSNMPIVIYKYTKSNGVVALFGNRQLIDVFEKSKLVKLTISESLPIIINRISAQKDNQGYMTFPSTHTNAEHEYYFENFVFESESNNAEYIGLALDITSRKLTEQGMKRNAKNLEKLNRELNQFSYIVSHDLKAPLRAVTNLSEWIEEDLKDFDNEETKENLKLMRSRIRRMENLINGILVYSRVSRTAITYEAINVYKLIQEIIGSLSISNKFTIVVSDNLPTIMYPLVNLEQIFSNLLSNAIKYHNKSEGKIEIGHRETPEFYEFWVADDGPGIAPEYHEKVFQIFQTLQARDTVESTGIGLTIVKKIIEERGGKIWIESGVGNGTKFLFTIPKESVKIYAN